LEMKEAANSEKPIANREAWNASGYAATGQRCEEAKRREG